MCYIPSNVWRLRLGCIQSRNIYRFFELEPIGGYLENDGVKIGIIIYLFFSCQERTQSIIRHIIEEGIKLAVNLPIDY